jgi:hypothetical protein
MTPFEHIYKDCKQVLDEKNKDNLGDILANCLGYQGLCNAYVRLFDTLAGIEKENKDLKDLVIIKNKETNQLRKRIEELTNKEK